MTLNQTLKSSNSWLVSGSHAFEFATHCLYLAVGEDVCCIVYLSFAVRRILVSETQFPSIRPRPTVGTELFLHAAYSEHASQWTTSP